MWSLLVVLGEPLSDELAHLGEASEQIQIQHLVSQAPVEAFDKGILVRLAWLDVVDKHPVGLAPFDEDTAEELRAVIDAQDIRQSPDFLQPLEYPYQPGRPQRGIDLDGQGFPVMVINDVEQPITGTPLERVTHEVRRPDLIRLLWHGQRYRVTLRQPSLGASRLVEPQGAVHTVDTLVVPGMAAPG